ncbi:hypothetical protein [Roseinatronobacter sp. S2]|uniref:hypothetical protein n=1 Tax=Roseinatronobacter sp. S2 TaxID=3035471 RepID=UPI00240FD50B|nr:hypothetical protein [Roseinatronobacter sp. S2]WFE75203.1 hypothetical protein P8S53_02000 [Roseinatronobacter sp. S2]
MVGQHLRWFVLLVIGGVLVAIGWVYLRDMRAVHARLQADARTIETAFGPVAYTTGVLGAPVRIIHARDIRLTPVANAHFTAAAIPGAETLYLDTGDDLLLGPHPEVRARIAKFLETKVDGKAE